MKSVVSNGGSFEHFTLFLWGFDCPQKDEIHILETCFRKGLLQGRGFRIGKIVTIKGQTPCWSYLIHDGKKAMLVFQDFTFRSLLLRLQDVARVRNKNGP